MKRSSFITWDQLRVGLVIVASLGILTLAVYKLGQAASLFTKRYALVAFLAEANGLREGGTVTVAGQLAGTQPAAHVVRRPVAQGTDPQRLKGADPDDGSSR
jgi:hypothetical protein